MADDLVERLLEQGADRVQRVQIGPTRGILQGDPLCAEAAERIAALTAERDAALARIARLEAALRFAQEVLEQAMNYIHDETPEVGTVEEARDDTLWKIRDADRVATSALEPEPEYTREEMREACRNNYNAGAGDGADLAARIAALTAERDALRESSAQS